MLAELYHRIRIFEAWTGVWASAWTCTTTCLLCDGACLCLCADTARLRAFAPCRPLRLLAVDGARLGVARTTLLQSWALLAAVVHLASDPATALLRSGATGLAASAPATP